MKVVYVRMRGGRLHDIFANAETAMRRTTSSTSKLASEYFIREGKKHLWQGKTVTFNGYSITRKNVI